MHILTTPAILLRRIDYGDYDLIITLFTLDEGKISAIAKSAKKSIKRFSGVLEIFSVLNVVYRRSQRKALPVLQAAALKHPFQNIREDIKKTAYASYWAELINQWLEEGEKQIQLYLLFQQVLTKLDQSRLPEETLSILFQMRFMKISGFYPNLQHCNVCRTGMEKIKSNQIAFDLVKGGLLCEKCSSGSLNKKSLSKGTIKQLRWLASGEWSKVERIRFSSPSVQESQEFLEAFVPYHLGKEPRSLKFLRQLRDDQC
ncbi:MAG: DNA repair protein RecO [Desulfobacterales bacterium]